MPLFYTVTCLLRTGLSVASYEIEDSGFVYIPEERERWKVDANCANTDTETFFPPKGKTLAQLDILKRICSNCPVIQECRDYAVDFYMDGIWGLTTPRQRQRIRGRKKIQLAAPPQG